MKLKNVVAGTVVSTLLALSGCGQGGGGDPTTVAEQFMDRYYTKANVQEAKALATPAAAQKIEAQFAELAKAVPVEQGKSHEVSYTLSEKTKEGDHAYHLYEITIKTKEGGPLYKRAALSVDRVDGNWRITQFDESASAASQTIR